MRPSACLVASDLRGMTLVSNGKTPTASLMLRMSEARLIANSQYRIWKNFLDSVSKRHGKVRHTDWHTGRCCACC